MADRACSVDLAIQTSTLLYDVLDVMIIKK